MFDIVSLAKYFTGPATWLGIAGAALLVFLSLFRTAATEHIVAKKVPPERAAGVVNLFMILVALITLVALILAFVDARDSRAGELSRKHRADYEKALAESATLQRNCVAEEEKAVAFTKPFNSPATARCPGGGCPLFSKRNCNFVKVLLSYSAPGDYFIDSYELVPGAMNDGNVGALVASARDSEGRVTAVQADLWCDPSNRPGAGGGWANATIQGVVRLRHEVEKREEILSACRAKYPPPVLG